MFKPSFLLLEDDPVIATYIQQQLIAAGYTTYCADTVEEAFDLCIRHLPQIALLNFHLPYSINGLQLAEALYARFAIHSCFITGSRQVDIPCPAYQDYKWLHKPFTQKQIKILINKVETLCLQAK